MLSNDAKDLKGSYRDLHDNHLHEGTEEIHGIKRGRN
jgi:hypothetical protein